MFSKFHLDYLFTWEEFETQHFTNRSSTCLLIPVYPPHFTNRSSTCLLIPVYPLPNLINWGQFKLNSHLIPSQLYWYKAFPWQVPDDFAT